MRLRLKKDIIIPAGTILSEAPHTTKRAGVYHYQASVGLSKDTCGSFEYYVDPSDSSLVEYFEDVP